MWEAIAALLGIAGMLLKQWLVARAEERNHTYENDAVQFDQALAAGATDALSAAFEQLRVPDETTATGNGDRGGPDDPTATERKL